MSRHRLHWWAYCEAGIFLACCLAAGALAGATVTGARILLDR